MNKHLLQGIDTVIVRVTDLDTSKNWYQEKLGLQVIWHDPTQKLVVLDTHGPTSLTLWQTDQQIAHNPATVSYPIFRNSDAAALLKEFGRRGIATGELHAEKHVQTFTFFDPDGNVLEACQVLG